MADGLIEPIPEGLQAHLESQLISAAVGTTMHNGRMHTVPFQVENIALFYNRDLWGSTPPATWEEVLEFSQGWNDPANNQWTMTWEAGVGFHNFIWLTAGGMELFGPNNDDFRNIGFDSPGAALGLDYYLRMRQLFDIPMADINWNTGEERFRLGEIPLTITGPWAIHESLQNGVNFGVTRFPTIEGRQPYAFSGVMQVAISSYSLNKPWAYAFAEFMVSPEGAAILYEYRHMMTTRMDVDLIPGLSDDPYLLGIAEQSPFTIPMPTIPEVSFMWAPLDEFFQFVWDGDLTIAESQERAMETYRTLLTVAGIDVDF
jgi:arabinogalactan oligomer/maltooligosaccharide transport system substrate-binding protein